MEPIDAEDFVQEVLNQSGINSCAVPLPRNFDTRLPFALVTRTGGQTYHGAADLHVLSVDVYAKTWEAAGAAASKAVGAIRGMGAAYIEGVQFYDADCNMPYSNPDPAHRDTPRVTFAATIAAGGKE